MAVQINELKRDIGVEVEQLVDKELNRLFPKRLIKRVLFFVPPDVDKAMFDYATAKRGRCWNYPPYGLGVIASYLRNSGLVIRIINLNNEVLKACRLSISKEDFDFDNVWKTILFNEITEFHPDIIGVTCMFSKTHESAVKVCNEIRGISPTLPIAIGGVHITNCFMEDKVKNILLNDFNNVDFLFLYEAELAFKQFIKVVNRDVFGNELYQVYFSSSPERLYFSTKKIPKENELDVIPAYDLMVPTELVNYGVIGAFFCLKEKGTKIATILSNRGCRGQCAYCGVRNFSGVGVRHRSVESVVDELFLLRDKYGIGHVMWLDDDLLHDHKRALRLFKGMVKQKIGITWDCTNGVIASSCKDEIIAAAAESGCIGLNLGVESGNPRILKKIKKPGSIDTFIKAAKILKKYEQINSRVFLMIGFSEETYRMILDTFDLAMRIDLDWYNVTIFQPLPNTPLFKSMLENGSLSHIEFENIRYNVGPYQKIREKINENLFLPNFRDTFKNVDLDTIPSKFQLDDIWFYMNYHLNFKRLYSENRLGKLQQHLKYLKNITDLIAPEDPFPMYFYGYLQKKVLGKTDQQLIKRLEERLHSSKYWEKLFDDFNLSAKYLESGVF